MKTAFLALLAAAVLGAAAACAFIAIGGYDVSATTSHTAPVYRLLEITKQRSVSLRARHIEPPALSDPALLARGAVCYRDHCVQCHGAPGVAPHDIGKSLQPPPGPLVSAAQRWHARELYWITRHGIKMSGMPAWQLRLSDADLWAVTAFVQRLPQVSPTDYRQAIDAVQSQSCRSVSDLCTAGACPDVSASPLQSLDRKEAARLVLHQYACITCNIVPGVVGPDTHVGPPLHEWWRRERIAGRWPNTQDNLMRWIRDPARLNEGTAMPHMGVTDEHARWMAEYLFDARH